MKSNKSKICMIVQDRMVKGGIAAVTSGYYGSKLETDYDVHFIESYTSGNKFTKLFKAITAYWKYIHYLATNKPDIVHIHTSFGPSFYREIPFILLADRFNIPIVNHIHGADFRTFYLSASKLKRMLVRWIYNKCEILVALSDQWRTRLSSVVDLNKIVIIPNYSELHEDALSQRHSVSAEPTILFLGELGQRKGCFDIPDVLERVAKEIHSVRLVLAGDGAGDDVQRIRKSLKERKIEDRVSFPGWVRGNQKDKLLRSSDLFFLPSYNEGMPMSVLDAMGYGLPIVSTTVGGIPLLVQNNKNGYCCQPGDTTLMAKYIVSILKHDHECMQFGRESFEIVKKSYSLNRHISLIESVYQSLL